MKFKCKKCKKTDEPILGLKCLACKHCRVVLFEEGSFQYEATYHFKKDKYGRPGFNK